MNIPHCSALIVASMLVVSVVAAAAGCVPIWTGNDMRADIKEVKTEQQKMRENYDAQKAKLTEMIASARQDVTELKDVLKKAKALLQRNNADLGNEIQKNRRQLSELRGKLEQAEFKVSRLEQKLELFKEDTDMRFEAITSELPDKPVALFEYGKKAYDNGKYRRARRALEMFGRKFGSHGKAADAQYLLGMALLEENQSKNAVAEFRKVVEDHPKSARVDDAVYQIGVALEKIGRCKQARDWFQLVVDDYGNSRWVGDARQSITSIKAGHCG